MQLRLRGGRRGYKGEADAALALTKVLKLQARLEDLTVKEKELVKQRIMGSKTYTY